MMNGPILFQYQEIKKHPFTVPELQHDEWTNFVSISGNKKASIHCTWTATPAFTQFAKRLWL